MRKSVKEIAAALGIQADSLPDAFVSRLLTDSRSPFEAEETLFIALSVKGGDGHRFILSLYNKGKPRQDCREGVGLSSSLA